MNPTRLLSADTLSAWTFKFPLRSTGRVYAKHECRCDIHRDEWALVERRTVSTFVALRAIERLEKAGWKRG